MESELTFSEKGYQYLHQMTISNSHRHMSWGIQPFANSLQRTPTCDTTCLTFLNFRLRNLTGDFRQLRWLMIVNPLVVKVTPWIGFSLFWRLGVGWQFLAVSELDFHQLIAFRRVRQIGCTRREFAESSFSFSFGLLIIIAKLWNGHLPNFGYLENPVKLR